MTGSFPTLHTSRLDLIEIRQNHLEDIFRLFGNEQVTAYYNIVTLTQKEEAQKFIDWFRGRFADQRSVRWGYSICTR